MLDLEVELNLDDNEKAIYIYPFCESAKRLLMYLVDLNIPVEGFISRGEIEIEQYLGKRIIKEPPKECDCILIPSDKKTVEYQWDIFAKIVEIPDTISTNLATYRDEQGESIFFSPIILNYIYKTVILKDKEFVLWGEKEDVTVLAKKYYCLGYKVSFCVTNNYDEEYDEGLELRNPFELLYESQENLFIWVLYGSERQARTFVKESGMNPDCFCCTLLHKLYRDICFDPNNGFTNNYSGYNSSMICQDNEESSVKIVVLGGSTTDSTLYIEKSWPEHLCDVLHENNIKVKLINAAVSGYGSSQELVTLIRDVIPQHPNIVISYSRVNDAVGERNYFVHPYLVSLYSSIVDNYKMQARDGSFMSPNLYFGEGVIGHGEHWLNQERMMNAICREFDIKFVSIIQPFFFEKKNKNIDDKELLECMGEDMNEYIRILTGIREYVRKEALQCNLSWIKDFSEIFDNGESIYRDRCHVNSEGNRVIAEQVFECIKECM